MDSLARWAGYLAIAGGALMAAILVVVTVSPNSPVAYVFVAVIPLLGGGVLGLYQRTRSAVGQLGKWSAWASTLGIFGLVVVGVYGLVTNQFSTDPNKPDPLLPLWAVTSVAWLGGSTVFAAALVRARALSVPGAWLVLAGAAGGLAVSILGGQNPPPVTFLVFAVYGVGWVVLGYAATRAPIHRPA